MGNGYCANLASAKVVHSGGNPNPNDNVLTLIFKSASIYVFRHAQVDTLQPQQSSYAKSCYLFGLADALNPNVDCGEIIEFSEATTFTCSDEASQSSRCLSGNYYGTDENDNCLATNEHDSMCLTRLDGTDGTDVSCSNLYNSLTHIRGENQVALSYAGCYQSQGSSSLYGD